MIMLGARVNQDETAANSRSFFFFLHYLVFKRINTYSDIIFLSLFTARAYLLASFKLKYSVDTEKDAFVL